MSDYDYLEAVFLQPCSGSAASAGRPQLSRSATRRAGMDRAKTVAALSRAYGQIRVWAILFLLVSPAFSKPIKPLLVPLLYQSQHQRDPSAQQNPSETSQDQLTLAKDSPFMKRPNLFSQNFALSLQQRSSPNSLSKNRQISLPKSSGTSFLVKDNSVSNLAPVYNSEADNGRIVPVRSDQQEIFKETQNEVEDFVRLLNTVNTDNHYRRTSNNINDNNNQVYSSDTSSRNVKLLNSNNVINNNYSSGSKRPLSPAITRGLIDTEVSHQEIPHSLVEHLNQQQNLFTFPTRISSSSQGVSLPQSSLSGPLAASPTTRGRLTASLPTLPASPGEEFNLLDGPKDSVEVVVSRVPRQTAEPTRLEQPTRGTATFLEEASSLIGMDSTDNSARIARGGSSSGSSSGSNSRITDHWSQPCRIDKASNPMSSPAYLSGHIFNNVNVAHKHAHRFKENFASQTWDGMSWESVLTVLPTDRFDFLNHLEVPTEEQLKSLQFNDVLPIAYESMQRRAVAIEQVTLDQALYRDLNNTDHLSEFRAIEGEIVSILCELHYAMTQQGVTQTEVITAEIMEEKFRDLERSSERAARDTVILMEYISGLDYLMAVFNHFKSLGT